jgi:cell division initiation protein
MSRITVVDIQHKTFKKQLQGYDRAEVDAFLDELIETIEDEATARAALEAEIADLRERISPFKSMDKSLQQTLVLAQRTADEVKAAAHKEADLIKQEARMQAERQVADLADRIAESRREHQRALDTTAQAKSELRSILLSHLSLIDRDRSPLASERPAVATVAPVATPPVAEPTPIQVSPERETIVSELVDELPPEPLVLRNGVGHTRMR